MNLFTRQLLRLFAAVVAFANLASLAVAQTTTARFQNDYTPGAASYRGLEDTWLFEHYGNNSKGAIDILTCGGWVNSTRWRPMIRVNMSSLANSYSSIAAARLKLKVKAVMVNNGQPWSNQTFHLYRVSDANRSWSAGTSVDGPQDGAACWNWRGFDHVVDPTTGQPGGTPWTGSRGCSTAGTDYLATPVASVTLSSSITPGTVITFNLSDLAHLGGWIGNHGTNAGYILMAPGIENRQNENIEFYSSEAAAKTDRPTFELDLTGYSPPPVTNINYTLPYEGRVSVNIYNSQGEVIRELTHAEPQLSGPHALEWNRRDSKGNLVPDGNYTWKLLETPQALVAKYIMQLGTNTTPDWDPFTGNDEGVRGLAVDASGVYLSGAVSEGCHLVLKQDDNGARLWTHHPWVENWQGGVSMAVDGGVLYMMQWNGKLARFNPANGDHIGTWDTRYNSDDHEVPNGGPRIPAGVRYEIAAKNSRLIVSFPARNAIRWLNITNGNSIQEVAVPSPQGVSLDGVGNAYIVSGTQIVKLAYGAGSATTLINNNLVKPWRVSIDPTNNDVLVFDAGSSQQVKRFSSAGVFKVAYGRAGGRQQGLYNGSDFQSAMSLAAAPDGSFWVTETYSMPRRTAHYSASGVLLKEFYGAQNYAVDCVVDPADPTLVWMAAGNGGVLQLKVDYTNKSWTVRATYAMNTMTFINGDTIPGPALSRGYGFAEDYVSIRRRNGNTYFCWDTYGPQVQMLDEANRKLHPMVSSGRVNDLPANLKPADTSLKWFMWVDTNADRQPSASELTFDARNLENNSWSGGNGHIGEDFVYHLHLYDLAGAGTAWPKSRPGRLAPRGWTAGGAPIYHWADMDWSGDPLPAEFNHTAPYSAWADTAGNLYGAYNLDVTYRGGIGGGDGFWAGRAGDTKLVKWGPDRKLQWVVGRQSRTGGADEGEMRYVWRITGMTHGCTVTQDVEHGLVHVRDQDGLWVGRCLDQLADDGQPDAPYIVGSEDWGGDVYTDPNTGRVYLYIAAGGGDRVYEISGWDNWVRQTGQVTVGGVATPSQGLFAEYFDNMDFTGASVTRLDPTVNFDWSNGTPDSVIGVDSFSARWVGQVMPATSETYTFHTTSDDGVRLWVNGQLLIDNWTNHGPTLNSVSIGLQAGQRYGIRLEYYENAGGAVIKLEWSTPSIARQIIPANRLGSGTGLSATYWDNPDFTGTSVANVSPTVNFDWSNGAPAPGIGADTFSARWSGRIQPLQTGTYTFFTQSDDGVRLWVNGIMVINNWTDHAPTENSGSIALNGGQHYDITMEYYEGGGGAIAKLLWSSATIAKQVVHQSVLYPPMSGTPSGIFELEPVHAPGMRLEVDNSSDSDGANVQLWGDYNGSSQRWQISPVSTGVVELAPLCATGRRLDVSGGANADGANVHLWTDNDSPAQRWQITEVAAGIYELSPLCAPGKVLDCYYSGTGNGTNVQIWSGGGGTNQRWRLLPP